MAIISAITGGFAGVFMFALGVVWLDVGVGTAFALYMGTGTAVWVCMVLAGVSVGFLRCRRNWARRTDCNTLAEN